MDALAHRASRRDLDWSESAQLAKLDTDLHLYWYLRGNFAVPPSGESLAEGAAVTGPITRREAQALAKQVGAKVLLPVLR